MLAEDPSLAKLHQYCSRDGLPPSVLGEYIPDTSDAPEEWSANSGQTGAEEGRNGVEKASSARPSVVQFEAAPLPSLRSEANTVWLVVRGRDRRGERDRPSPSKSLWLSASQAADRQSIHSRRHVDLELDSLYCCGCLYRTSPSFIFYRRCSAERGHFFQARAGVGNSRDTGPRPRPLPGAYTDFEYWLHQMNSAAVVDAQLRRRLEEVQRAGTPARSAGATAHASPGATSNGRWHLSQIPANPTQPRGWSLVAVALATWRLAMSVITGAGTVPMPWGRGAAPKLGKPAQDHLQGRGWSLAWSHIWRRCRRLQQLPGHVRELEARARVFTPAEFLAEPLLALNCLMVHTMVDVALGALLALLIWRHSRLVIAGLQQWGNFLHIDVLRKEIEWLNNYPGGFKLNVPLTRRLGSMVVMVLEVHEVVVLRYLARTGVQEAVLRAVALAGALGLGATSMLALAFDLVRLMTAHLHLVYAIFARVYYLELSILASLWHLFRGKKYNVLRHRIDTCEYGTQQLLLGTLLFTIFSCLFPTIAVFHAFFSMVQGAVLAVQGALWLLFIAIRDAPVYPAFVLLTDPDRLPDGIRWGSSQSPASATGSAETDFADGSGSGWGGMGSKSEGAGDGSGHGHGQSQSRMWESLDLSESHLDGDEEDLVVDEDDEPPGGVLLVEGDGEADVQVEGEGDEARLQGDTTDLPPVSWLSALDSTDESPGDAVPVSGSGGEVGSPDVGARRLSAQGPPLPEQTVAASGTPKTGSSPSLRSLPVLGPLPSSLGACSPGNPRATATLVALELRGCSMPLSKLSKVSVAQSAVRLGVPSWS
jgi:hypothetical protein